MDEMRAKAVAPTARTYTAAIASCGQAGAGQVRVMRPIRHGTLKP